MFAKVSHQLISSRDSNDIPWAFSWTSWLQQALPVNYNLFSGELLSNQHSWSWSQNPSAYHLELLCLGQYVESVHDSDMMRCRSSPPRSNRTGLQLLIQRWPGRGWRRIHRGDHITYHWVIGVGLTSDTEELCSPQGFYCAYWGHLQTTK